MREIKSKIADEPAGVGESRNELIESKITMELSERKVDSRFTMTDQLALLALRRVIFFRTGIDGTSQDRRKN